MKLHEYLVTPNATFPVRVVGNGYPTSNVPMGAGGEVLEVSDHTYKIKWDKSNYVEVFDFSGGLSMTLDVEEQNKPLLHFHVVKNRWNVSTEPLTLDFYTCLGLAAYFPSADYLSKDISEWGDTAKHGDVYKINDNMHLLAINPKLFHSALSC